jgi:hypothetical protein
MDSGVEFVAVDNPHAHQRPDIGCAKGCYGPRLPRPNRA